MQCPRCGYRTDGMTQVCPRCGLALPSSAQLSRRMPTEPNPSIHQAIDGVWREEDTGEFRSIGSAGMPGIPGNSGDIGAMNSGGTVPNNGDADGEGNEGPPSWLMRALREANPNAQQQGQGQPPQPNQSNIPSRSLIVPPAFTPEQQGASEDAQPLFPRFGPRNFEQSSAGHMSLSPATGIPGSSVPMRMPGQGLPGNNYGGLAPVSGFIGLDDQPGPGAILKGGRYRLLQRFYGNGRVQPPGNEPSLMIASDTELPNGRVLVQEIALNSVRPEDSENARRLIAQRLLSLPAPLTMTRLVDHFSERRHHFLVFELPAGDLLADRLQRARGPMPEPEAIRLILQVLTVLAAFEHQSPPFVHGNLSPANIILRPSGQPILVGCSSHLLLYPNGVVDHPPAGGMPGYAAPEQVRGRATPRSDLFALCAILQQAVTGVAPSPRANTLHPPARHQNPNVSLELEEVLSRGLRPSSTQRYQTAAELSDALQPLAAGRATHVPEELQNEGARGTLMPRRDARGRLVLPRQRGLQSPLFLIGIIFSLLVLVGVGVLYAVSPRGRASVAPTPNSLAMSVQQFNVGLSGGEFAFDTQRPDSGDKTAGSAFLASGDLKSAHNAFTKAMTDDAADAEAAIYAEDVQIALDHAPFITVVVGTSLDPNADPTSVAASRSELQGIYLAQHHLNSVGLAGRTRVRVLVLNSGATASGATRAADVLLQEVQQGNVQHLVGVIGWPELAQTQLAQSELKASGLPFINPTLSDDSMKNFESSIFRMVALNSVQAQEMADTAVQQMTATNILVLSDAQDAISSSMAKSFTHELQQLQTTHPLFFRTANYTSNASTDFNAIAFSALAQGANLIYLSTGQQGGDLDSIDLAKAVVAASTARGITAPHILVDSRAYTPALYGLGNDAAASIVQDKTNLSALSDLYVQTLADQNEWTALQLTSSVPETFNNSFENQYGTNLSPDGLVGPNAGVLLSYDAFRLLAAASAHSLTAVNGAITYPTPIQVIDALYLNSPDHPFVGISGAISYDISGNINGDLVGSDKGPGRAFGILQFIPFTSALQNGQVARAQVAYVAGGASYFCHQQTCGLSQV